MTFNLHPEARKRAVALLADAIPEVIVNNKMFLDRSTTVWLFIDHVLPKHGSLHDTLISHLGEFPLYEFVEGRITQNLYRRDEYNSKFPKLPLTDFDGYKNPNEAAEELIKEFETLPWSYIITFEFPEALSELLRNVVNSVKFGTNVRLVSPDDQFEAEYPLVSKDEKKDKVIHEAGLSLLSLAMTSPPKWNREAVYLQIKVDGFVGQWGHTEATRLAESMLKAFCGLCVALRIFKVETNYPLSAAKTYSYLHRVLEQGCVIDNRLEVKKDLADTMRSFAIHDLDGSLETPEMKNAWVRTTLTDIQVVFSNSTKAEKVLLGSQWLFESYAGGNELLSFVQTMVALEILLGEESTNEGGLGELLRNRCAFLIAESHEQRSELLTDFKEIYRVRSQIVHRGKSRLTAHERMLFHKLQWICRRVIQAEVKLLKADEAKANKRILAAPQSNSTESNS